MRPSILGMATAVAAALAAVLAAVVPGRAHTEPPAELTRAEWVVEDLAGRGLVDRSRVTLAFTPEGRVSGHASCNRFMGGYALHDQDLGFSPLGTTRMACAEALMRQEQDFLALMAAVVRYEIDATGALRLVTRDGRAIVARR